MQMFKCKLCNNLTIIIMACTLYLICLMVLLMMPSMTISSSSSSSKMESWLYNHHNGIDNYDSIIIHQASQLSQQLQQQESTTQQSNKNSLDNNSFHNRKLQNHVESNENSLPFQQASIKLNDVFISVKTTRIFHKSRLDIILDTWYQLAKNQTYFFTDAIEEPYKTKLGKHLVNTNCSVSHNRKALCCKMSVEFDYFIEHGEDKKWWCHFDDDDYVNVPRLLHVLGQFDPLNDWYLGKTSIKKPLEIEDRETKKKIYFSFATGGAGFCISRALALKMVSVASNGRLISVGDRIRLPDDVTIGYIIEYMLQKKLTPIKEFHSHLEPMAMLERSKLKDQVSFSYSGNNISRNVLSINQIDPVHVNDSTRFYSLHCFLFPQLCPKQYRVIK